MLALRCKSLEGMCYHYLTNQALIIVVVVIVVVVVVVVVAVIVLVVAFFLGVIGSVNFFLPLGLFS